jgi:hypothetical protein
VESIVEESASSPGVEVRHPRAFREDRIESALAELLRYAERRSRAHDDRSSSAALRSTRAAVAEPTAHD